MANTSPGIPIQVVVQGVEGPPDYDQPAPPHPEPEPSSLTEPRPSGIVKRAMEKTADKLHRSKSAATRPSQLSQSQPSLPAGSQHKRVFSLSRKGKERMSADGIGALLCILHIDGPVPEHRTRRNCNCAIAAAESRVAPVRASTQEFAELAAS